VSIFRRYAIPLNLLVIAVTVVFVGAALVVGRAVAAPTVEIAPGLTSPEDYIAPRPIDIVDETATQIEREAEAFAVQTKYSVNPDIMPRVRNEISAFFEDLRRLATLTVEEANIEVEPTEIELAVRGAGGLDMLITESEGIVRLIGTVPDQETRENVISAVKLIAGVIEVDDSGLVIEPPPTTTTETPSEGDETTTTVTTTTVIPPTTTTTLPRRTIEDWTLKLTEEYPDLSDTTILSFVTLYNNDLDRIGNGEAPLFQAVQDAADALAKDLLTEGIKVSELGDVKAPLLSETPPVFVSVLPVDERLLAHPAIGELVANELLPNLFEDEEATTLAREEAAAAVQNIKVPFPAFSLIAAEGEVLTRVQVDAITELGLIEKEPGTSRQAIVVLGALTVALAAFFLWRLAPGQWSQPKHFALMGILLVLAALASRFPEMVNTAVRGS